MIHNQSLQGKMGFSSAGVGLGCSFFFELPLYAKPPSLPPSPLELFKQEDMEPLQQEVFPTAATPRDLRLVSVINEHAALTVEHNGVAYIFSPDKHGSHVESSSLLFDHVFQKMLLPQKQFPTYKKSEIKYYVPKQSHLT